MGYLSRQVLRQQSLCYDTFKTNFKLIESPKGKKFQRQEKNWEKWKYMERTNSSYYKFCAEKSSSKRAVSLLYSLMSTISGNIIFYFIPRIQHS